MWETSDWKWGRGVEASRERQRGRAPHQSLFIRPEEAGRAVEAQHRSQSQLPFPRCSQKGNTFQSGLQQISKRRHSHVAGGPEGHPITEGLLLVTCPASVSLPVSLLSGTDAQSAAYQSSSIIRMSSKQLCIFTQARHAMNDTSLLLLGF